MILRPAPTVYACPACTTELRAVPGRGIPAHACPGVGGLTVPLVDQQSVGQVRLQVNEREDYLGRARGVRTVNGRPVSSVSTFHADGRVGCTVYPDAATAVR